MSKFKNIIIIITIPIICGWLLLHFYNSIYNHYTDQLELKRTNNQKVKDQDYTCTNSDQENFQQISKDNNLDFYQGEVVKEEIAKSFSNPLIPDNYQVSTADLEQAYALGKDDQPVFLLLEFSDEEKFDKMKEFFEAGELIVGYSLRVDSTKKQMFFAPDYETLDLYIKIFQEQDCY